MNQSAKDAIVEYREGGGYIRHPFLSTHSSNCSESELEKAYETRQNKFIQLYHAGSYEQAFLSTSQPGRLTVCQWFVGDKSVPDQVFWDCFRDALVVSGGGMRAGRVLQIVKDRLPTKHLGMNAEEISFLQSNPSLTIYRGAETRFERKHPKGHHWTLTEQTARNQCESIRDKQLKATLFQATTCIQNVALYIKSHTGTITDFNEEEIIVVNPKKVNVTHIIDL